MRYYREAATKKLRTAFEGEVLNWPEVSTKKMFGCPCYQARGKLFVFLVTNGIVITQLAGTDRDALSKRYPTSAFRAGKKTVPRWVRLSMESAKDLNRLIPFVRKSYESARRRGEGRGPLPPEHPWSSVSRGEPGRTSAEGRKARN